MSKCCFKDVKISGLVTCVPTDEKSIDDELELFGGNVKQLERLKKTIGLSKRRVVDDNTTAADLCEQAARRLLEASSLELEQVDAMICVTQTPDYSQPCNAAVLHGRLGLSKNCASLDVSLGCSGYVYGLWLAHSLVASGAAKRVLLLAGDTISRLVNAKDRAVAPLFGDGGSASLIEHSTTIAPAYFSLQTDGSGYDKLIVPAGGARQPRSEDTAVVCEDEGGNFRSLENLYMDGAEIFNFSITEEPKSVKDLLEYAQVEADAVDYFVFHQANRYILGNIAKRLKLDLAKVPMQTVEQFGNQSSASIPSAICGELAAPLAARDSTQLLLSGFGVGLSWASALVDMSELSVCELIDYSL
ncbi:3-oxoacyl-[acyl-carrier-protein] synthase III C-terminal domain-containing protein [Coraliomargarita sp. SDUM461003]|uniref:3-oxoacyl-[acyl-carrier-protein] synthase III C-terminal domain-containing protein n=1 Tax=Thalassobacterium maritimum TaxID=3041265 RepID=A0ABU1AQY1_9BACT|nr:3-oxoacyl-[acyl-carrier-protein] synthase III C-terminal domain-containing protein [Coraliomargarita sp. SDUM461003]MDQ8206551.1 3-oxoacyl-[acyl-carrier-protein] synthase III C-terminal domain-containing protein [Coraliomargarita sp. SDUM461003]